MLTGRFEDAGERSPEELAAAYVSLLAEVLEEVGTETAAAETELDESTLAALEETGGDLTLEEAAAVLALSEEYPDAQAITAEARDILLMGMTTAVLDVDALASKLGGELEPKLIQQKVEGRYPMTLTEYAQLHYAIEHNKR